MSRMKSQLAMLSMMGVASVMMGGNSMCGATLPPDDFDGCNPTRKIEPPIPKGMKYFMFDKHGGYSTDRMRNEDFVFGCYAINSKNAIKKFNKHKSDSLTLTMK